MWSDVGALVMQCLSSCYDWFGRIFGSIPGALSTFLGFFGVGLVITLIVLPLRGGTFLLGRGSSDEVRASAAPSGAYGGKKPFYSSKKV